MRLDKYLKNSRLIKRRTIAKEACSQGRIKVNGQAAKASSIIKIDDIIEIQFGQRNLKVQVVNILEHVLKSEALNMYKIIDKE